MILVFSLRYFYFNYICIYESLLLINMLGLSTPIPILLKLYSHVVVE
jgi:hypothetical protein